MATPITWKSISSQTTGDPSASIARANTIFQGALDAGGDIADTFEAHRKKGVTQETNHFLDEVNKRFRTPDQLNLAQQSGALDQLKSNYSNLDPSLTGSSAIDTLAGAARTRIEAENQFAEKQLDYNSNDAYNAIQQSIAAGDNDRATEQLGDATGQNMFSAARAKELSSLIDTEKEGDLKNADAHRANNQTHTIRGHQLYEDRYSQNRIEVTDKHNAAVGKLKVQLSNLQQGMNRDSIIELEKSITLNPNIDPSKLPEVVQMIRSAKEEVDVEAYVAEHADSAIKLHRQVTGYKQYKADLYDTLEIPANLDINDVNQLKKLGTEQIDGLIAMEQQREIDGIQPQDTINSTRIGREHFEGLGYSFTQAMEMTSRGNEGTDEFVNELQPAEKRRFDRAAEKIDEGLAENAFYNSGTTSPTEYMGMMSEVLGSDEEEVRNRIGKKNMAELASIANRNSIMLQDDEGNDTPVKLTPAIFQALLVTADTNGINMDVGDMIEKLAKDKSIDREQLQQYIRLNKDRKDLEDKYMRAGSEETVEVGSVSKLSFARTQAAKREQEARDKAIADAAAAKRNSIVESQKEGVIQEQRRISVENAQQARDNIVQQAADEEAKSKERNKAALAERKKTQAARNAERERYNKLLGY